ncbi:GNAT family N-acetyltransferase [Chromobacterium sp. IIBBL 290-4]|uniref:GNAT family N-acetyltransferase n=1 Tax=Chromobacterium sp. IIBBL 290-4 TaxID=2953890 RepID=UPI0020B89DC1|nr:GNAT family N-acetyltransferase [Chromobacterium sp. IIBBL 290-4]UTH75940.1 GNAT family N-acetyltransferase [Chromobacterium sp. IIBBL 290-4]
MEIRLRRAMLQEAAALHAMQLAAFLPLLRKYQDHDISPATETLASFRGKLAQAESHFYWIERGPQAVGGLRVAALPGSGQCRISPLFILPAFQNQGIAQAAMRLAERLHQPDHGWRLDTILEERGNCHLYEKLGYVRVGQARMVKPGMHLVVYHKACAATR